MTLFLLHPFRTSRLPILALAACALLTGAAHAQQTPSIASPDMMQGMPDAQGLPSAAVPDAPGMSLGGHPHGTGPLGDDAPRYQHPNTDDKHFEWGNFLTDATRTGFNFAVPRLSQNGGAGVGGASFMGGNFVTPGINGGTNGGGGRAGGVHPNTWMDLSSGLLNSLGNSTGGALGTTLHTLSGLTNSRSGYALSTAGSGVDFHVSGSLGNVLGSSGSVPTGTSQGNGGIGAVPSMRGGGGSRGPSLSLKLKF